MVALLRWLTGARGAVRPAVLVSGGVAASAVAVVIAIAVPGGGGGGTCDLNATTATFAAQISAATGGQTVCLATGSYGTWNGVAKTSPGVTIKPQSGATPTMSINFVAASPAVAWLTIDSVTLIGGLMCNPTHDVTFKSTTITKEFDILTGPGVTCGGQGQMSNNNIVFDGATWTQSADPVGSALFWEGRLSFGGGSSAASAGVQVKNSTFDGTNGPCADGIQFTNAANSSSQPIEIGPNNTFKNLDQNACNAIGGGAHVDSIQWVDGGDNVYIHDNYFHNNSDGLVNFDASPLNVRVINNVFQTIFQDTLHVCASRAITYEHNTLSSAGGGLSNCDNHNGTTGQNTVNRNNILGEPATNDCFSGSCGVAGTFAVNDYNVCTTGTCPGAHSLNGSVSWTGGATPTTFAGFTLALGSRGLGVASDLTNIGVNP